jgi:hypothetical protein
MGFSPSPKLDRQDTAVGVNPQRTDGLQSIRCMAFIRALAVGVNPHRTNYALTDVMNPAVRKNVRILYKIMISQDFKVWLLHKRQKLPLSTRFSIRFQDFWAIREREIAELRLLICSDAPLLGPGASHWSTVPKRNVSGMCTRFFHAVVV